MSFNNWIDAEAAWRLVNALPSPAAVVVKHTNPCGAAVGDSPAQALAKAWAGDPLAAFGGVVAINAGLDAETATLISQRFVEVVVVPESPDAGPLSHKPDLRLLEAFPPGSGDLDLRRMERGFVAQERDESELADWKVMTSTQPTPEQWEDLRLAWTVAAHTKSNAVVLAAGGATVGVGSGDQSRVGAVRRALAVALARSRSAVAASDAFFPFRDGIDELASAGVGAVVAPSGSRRDQEVIDAANEHGLALVFTGRRHFRH
jgi:phosphoribosylaminoimidazolecarboxamide formyltransferase/IMP cyclohydrolase